MKRLCIKNLGPLKSVSIELGRFNLIIGKQSSGKSCVLKTACYCAWVEKYIQLAQSADSFVNGKINFIENFVSYHKLKGYIQKDTSIEYESDYMHFSYEHINGTFYFEWKKKRMEYKRPKISYIPSERNIVSLIPDWKSQVSAYDCVLDFMKDWDIARKYVQTTPDILNLGLRYQYDETTKEDNIYLPTGFPIALTNSSSGVQSIVPMYVCLDYITREIYNAENDKDKKRTELEREKYNNLLFNLYNQSKNIEIKSENKRIPIQLTIANEDFLFGNEDSANAFKDYVNRYTLIQGSDVYLEEPENNLFPPTQCQFTDWLIELSKRRKKTVSLFVTTHSPYILTHLLQQKIPGFRLFFTYQSNEATGCNYTVHQATEEELQEIYDNGLDMFFNYEAFIK